MGLREVRVPPKLLTHPCVLANCESKSEPVACYIPNDEQGQYTAVQALLAAGYRCPICLHLPVNHLATYFHASVTTRRVTLHQVERESSSRTRPAHYLRANFKVIDA